MRVSVGCSEAAPFPAVPKSDNVDVAVLSIRPLPLPRPPRPPRALPRPDCFPVVSASTNTECISPVADVLEPDVV